MDYSAMIQVRKSVRAFLDTPVPAALLEELGRYFNEECKKLVPSLDADLRIFGSDVKEPLEGMAGYSEYTVGAPCYFAILSDKQDNAVENAGFIAEDLILKLTEHTLDSCWLTFQDGEVVKKALGIQSDKELCALVAFGHGRKTSKQIRLNIQNRSKVDVERLRTYYAPKLGIEELVYVETWGRSEGLYDVIGDMNSTLWRAFYAASLSPSYLNRQPYRFVVIGGTVVLVSIEEAATDVISQKLNLGIVMLHFSGVVSKMLYDVPWVMGEPEQKLELPVGCKVVSYCKVY